MKVALAKSAGFCFGVKRAVEMVYQEVGKGKNVYTFGPIIHNEEVVEDLSRRGVIVIHDIGELDRIKKGTVIIRSHGISKEIHNALHNKGFDIMDATCPYVKKIHRIVEKEAENENQIIIIGNAKHPEVDGIQGWSNRRAVVIETVSEALKYTISEGKKLCVVAQTTFSYKKFKELVEILTKKGYDIFAMNTICNATEERQREAKQLAKRSDAMIVVGGKNSSNTQKLYEICQNECESTYYIQTLNDLDLNLFKSFRSVGITAGASTPNNIIEEVHVACQK